MVKFHLLPFYKISVWISMKSTIQHKIKLIINTLLLTVLFLSSISIFLSLSGRTTLMGAEMRYTCTRQEREIEYDYINFSIGKFCYADSYNYDDAMLINTAIAAICLSTIGFSSFINSKKHYEAEEKLPRIIFNNMVI